MLDLFGHKTTDFSPNAQWFNVDRPLSLEKDLKGRIVVLDFWTYCCINCIHLLPKLHALENEFEHEPVAFIGVHAPKFQNEKDAENLERAIDRYDIRHPVIGDPNHELWNAFGINAWPTLVVLDEKGRIAYKKSGEQHPDLRPTLRRLLDNAAKNQSLASTPLALSPPARGTKKSLSFPGKIDYDWKNRWLAVSDSNHHRILVARLNGLVAKIVHVIGSGEPGLDDGSFERAQFRKPQGVHWRKNELFVADTENHAIRQIDFNAKRVTTLGGNGEQAPHIPGLDRQGRVVLNSPWDLHSHDDHLYIAMAGSHQIWRMRLTDRRFEPFAGTGGENIVDGPNQLAFFAQPSGLTSDGERLLVADSETSSIRAVGFIDKNVETIVGRGLFEFGHADGPLAKTRLQHPLGIDYREGKIYVADTYNHAIRLIDIARRQTSTLVAMEKKNAKTCKIGITTCAELPLWEPSDVLALDDGLLIADTNNHLIRKLDTLHKKLADITIEF